jgi:UDP-GlcNAc:undecaprenyl-phosphate/decaprenyl-phosphate GlcNAc-1-phosphate transferase
MRCGAPKAWYLQVADAGLDKAGPPVADTPSRLSFFAPLIAFAIAATIGLVLTPMIAAVARRYGWLDEPDGQRRMHKLAVPRLGGVAIFAGVLAGLFAVLLLPAPLTMVGPETWRLLPGLLAGGAIVFIVGLFDDLRGVPPVVKLLAQTAAALLALAFGFDLPRVGVIGVGTIELGWMGAPLAVLWIVGVSNAFNLIDGVDGLAGSVALIGLGGVAVSSLLLGHTVPLLIAAALAGGMAAFLRYNKSPATIFLGDSGSLVVGFLLAVLTVQSAATPDGTVQAFVPLAVLAFPLLDTAIAMARRWLRGDPLSRADGRHVHHQLLALGLSPKATTAVLAAVFTVVAGLGLLLTFAPPNVVLSLAALSLVFGTTGLAYALRWLNYDEFIEFGASLESALRKARAIVRTRILAREVGRDVAEAPSLDALRALLSERAADLSLLDIELVLDDARSHEADGILPADGARRPWRLDCPVVVPGEDRSARVLTLRLWCERQQAGQSVNAERIAARLVPAIEAWHASRGVRTTGELPASSTSSRVGNKRRRRSGAS